MKRTALILWAVAVVLLLVAEWGHLTEADLFGTAYPGGERMLTPVAGGLLVLSGVLRFLAERHAPPPIDPGAMGEEQRATSGGVAVLAMTGIASAAGFALFGTGSTGAPLGLLIAAILVPGALLLRRFIARHGGEIGEARFDTRNPEER